MGGPYSLLRYSSGNSGIEIPVDFAASGTLTAVCGNAVLIEYTALMTGSLMAVVSGQHGDAAPASERAYSLLRYSINPGRHFGFPVEQISTAELNAVAGPAVPIDIRAAFSGTLNGKTSGTVALQTGIEAAGALSGEVGAQANIEEAAEFGAELLQASAGVKNIGFTSDFADALNAKILSAKNIITKLSLSGAINGRQYGSKNIRNTELFSAVLTALAGAVTQETDTVSVTVTIPPGAELRIDSDTYRVTLNGQNILYAQSGDWVYVSRDLLRLNIESTSGGAMSGNLIYTERYL